MSKPRQVPIICLKSLIVSTIMFGLFSLLCTVLVASGIQPLQIADSTSRHIPSSILDAGMNNSVINASSLNSNASSLNSSPQSIINSMRNPNETLPVPLPVPGKQPQILPNKNYIFSENKSEISTPSNSSHKGEFGKGVRIAVVMPTFTAAAYDHSFYVFYKKYINVTQGVNITRDLNLLSSKVTNQPSLSASGIAMLYLLGNLKWVSPQANIAFLTDQDADEGSIFQANGSNAYDVIILGHQEYVTQREYDNFKQFVGAGGTMIILDGNVFYAQVKYDNKTNNITLVKGHSWAFNGKSAWRSVNERWENETAQWVGSNYISDIAKFGYNPFGYSPHEEQYITNPKDIILLNYNATESPEANKTGSVVVATYELNYLKGRVIALGLYSDDIIVNGNFDRYFDSLVLQYAEKTQD